MLSFTTLQFKKTLHISTSCHYKKYIRTTSTTGRSVYVLLTGKLLLTNLVLPADEVQNGNPATEFKIMSKIIYEVYTVDQHVAKSTYSGLLKSVANKTKQMDKLDRTLQRVKMRRVMA